MLQEAEIQCRALSSQELQKDKSWWDIYAASFPLEEQESPKIILDSLGKGGVALAAKNQRRTVGIAAGQRLEEPDVFFFAYLGIAREQQRKGIGSLLANSVPNLAATEQWKPQGVVLEIDDPACTLNSTERERREQRQEFYQRLGYVPLNFPYRLPPMRGEGEGMPMRLMYRDFEKDEPNPVRLAQAIYTQRYGAISGLQSSVLLRLYSVMRLQLLTSDPRQDLNVSISRRNEMNEYAERIVRETLRDHPKLPDAMNGVNEIMRTLGKRNHRREKHTFSA